MRKAPGKAGVFLEVIHKISGMSSFSPLPMLSLFLSSNKKDLTLPQALINILLFVALFIDFDVKLRSSLGLFEERIVENSGYIYVKKKNQVSQITKLILFRHLKNGKFLQSSN